MTPLVECVPNFSEGRDAAVIAQIAAAIGSIPAVALLDQSADADHHRSVFTFAGPPGAVAEAAFRAAAVAVERIDLRRHQGVHPRIGAVDVIPFVPIRGLTRADCIPLAHGLGERLWQELRLPVYFYGEAALRPERQRLENIRRGGFEALCAALPGDAARCPDIGEGRLHPSAGAAMVGVRKFLIAYNVNLQTSDVAVARKIASAIRESSGGLPCVKALGLPLASRGMAQVSMNLTDFEVTPIHAVFERICEEARSHGVEVAESELVGLAPGGAIEQAAAHFLKLRGFQPDCVLEHRLRRALGEEPAVS